MSTGTLKIVETYSVHCCTQCGVSYALTDAFEGRRREDHKTFYCPNGHSQYSGERGRVMGDVDYRDEEAEGDILQVSTDPRRDFARFSSYDAAKGGCVATTDLVVAQVEDIVDQLCEWLEARR